MASIGLMSLPANGSRCLFVMEGGGERFVPFDQIEAVLRLIAVRPTR